jgi:beta-mannosidase
MGDMRELISLSGPDWYCAQSNLRGPDAAEIERLEKFAASVPGEVRLDLARAGLLKDDPFYGRDNDASRWVEDRDWWYWRDFDLKLEPGQRAWLVLHGADYYTWTYLNGELLGEHEGMFSRQVYDITNRRRERNRLAVRFLAPARFSRERSKRSTRWEKLLNRWEQRFIDVSCDPDRRDALKCQMSYGWDFAPELRTIGLWDAVDVIVTGEVALFDAQVKTRLAPGRAALVISFDADALTAGPVTFTLSLEGQTFKSDPVTRSFRAMLPAGRSRQTFEMQVRDPRLWFPWDHGEQNLYMLTIEAHGEEHTLDRVTESVGLREISQRRNPGSPPSAADWTFVVNGQPVYLRGANWVPADAFPARVTEDDYRAWLTMAREANLNALRVWGGGLREKKAFYDLCDRLGLLVWQEFPLACAFITRYPRSKEYLAFVESETRDIVRQVRLHPSVMLWCGGNEFDPKANRLVIEAMRRAATAEDGTRPFQDVSPAFGESHNWSIWHRYRPPEEYQKDTAQVMSEFGLQAPPPVASLRRFIPPDELWPPGPSWKVHRAQMPKLKHYAHPYRISNELDEFVRASQQAQAHGIQIAVEHARRRKYATSGFLVWQLNSPWPGVDWAIVDYYRALKPAYERLKEIAHPLLVSLDYALRRYSPGDVLTADVWVVNDWPRDFPGCRVEIVLQDTRQVFVVNVGPDSAAVIGRVTWTLPQGDWRVTCRLAQGESALAENHYDLAEYDGKSGHWWNVALDSLRLALR